MADSHKSTVVIASVLKPVDDSRMYEKIGLTLADSGEFAVHVIGCASAKINNSRVIQHPFKPFKRISLGRLFAPWRIMMMTLRLKPDVFIFATHELLYLAMFLKITRKCRIIYDVQENYYWNILYTTAFPLVFRPFVALYVRAKEMLSARYIDHFFLAEKGYEQELSFPGNRFTVIENKVRIEDSDIKLPAALLTKEKINLIFSGTLSETTGVFTAIDVAVKLHVIDDRFRLTIIGFCSQPNVLEKIRLLIRPRSFIKLVVRDRPVPHADIFKHIQLSDFGLVTYQINPSTMNSIPTKLYEYLGFHLPFLLVNHKSWVDYCQPYDAAIIFDPAHYDAGTLYRDMMQRSFYTNSPSGVYWESEAPKLLAIVRKLRPAFRHAVRRAKVLE
jgi:glycosyltransferase involved in cell wall biosynthesis